MEDSQSRVGRTVTARFEFDRNGQQLLAQAYQRLLATMQADAHDRSSVQIGEFSVSEPSILQEVDR